MSPNPRKRLTRAQNSSTSSSAKMLPSDSIGTAWRTLANFSDGGAPTLRLILAVVAPVVLGDFRPEARMLGPRLGEGELHRLLFGRGHEANLA